MLVIVKGPALVVNTRGDSKVSKTSQLQIISEKPGGNMLKTHSIFF